MREPSDETAPSFDEAREQLREGLENARRLVEQARFMFGGGESDESPA
jgi:hypothetical protein